MILNISEFMQMIFGECGYYTHLWLVMIILLYNIVFFI